MQAKPVIKILLLCIALSLAVLSHYETVIPGAFLGASMVLAYNTPSLDVPFVPTPQTVVEEMLDLAGVCGTDVLCDLGCGDGRIVVTAAEQYGTRGVGVDIDPERIRESNQNAAEKRVSHLVSFRRQSIFETDFRSASVVTLYLLPSINLKLRPKLLAELKPGSRIVSHDFDMGDWKPDQTTQVEGHDIHLWIVPANLNGKWRCTVRDGRGEKKLLLHVGQEFQNVRGRVRNGSLEQEVEFARINGNLLRFQVQGNIVGSDTPAVFEGRVRGDSIEGSLKSAGKRFMRPVSWSAVRDPRTKLPLDGLDATTGRLSGTGPIQPKALIAWHPAQS